MKVNTKKLAATLKLAARGLYSYGSGSDCNVFVFGDGKIRTFNGEVRVQVEDPIGLDAAVPSVELISLINRFSTSEIDIQMSDDSSEVRVKGAGARAGITCEASVLGDDDIPSPGNWFCPHENFVQDLLAASKVCGTDDSMAVTMCIRILPDRIEACDNYRAIRITQKTGLSGEFYLLAENASALDGLKVLEVSLDSGWMHVRFDGGMISLRGRVFMEYPDLDPLMAIDGDEIFFPKELSYGIQSSQVFTDSQPHGGMKYLRRVTVSLGANVAKISTGSSRGWYDEALDIEYDGPTISFDAHPDSLQQILDHSFALRFTKGKLVAKRGGVCMVIATRIPNE